MKLLVLGEIILIAIIILSKFLYKKYKERRDKNESSK